MSAAGQFYTVLNQAAEGEPGDGLRSGFREVYVVQARKWVTLLDWATGDRVRVHIEHFVTMSPVLRAQAPRLKFLQAGMVRAHKSRAMFKDAIQAARAAR